MESWILHIIIEIGLLLLIFFFIKTIKKVNTHTIFFLYILGLFVSLILIDVLPVIWII